MVRCRVSGVRRVRGREQPTFQTVKVKALTMLEASQPKPNAIELADDFLGNLPVVDLLVIRRVFAQEILIGLGERTRGDATLIPGQNHPATCLQDARKFCFRLVPIKPMKRLSGGHEVNTLFRQCCSFSSAGNALKMWVALQQSLASFPLCRFGSTANTGFPWRRNNSVRIPVPDPTSAMTEVSSN